MMDQRRPDPASPDIRDVQSVRSDCDLPHKVLSYPYFAIPEICIVQKLPEQLPTVITLIMNPRTASDRPKIALIREQPSKTNPLLRPEPAPPDKPIEVKLEYKPNVQPNSMKFLVDRFSQHFIRLIFRLFIACLFCEFVRLCRLTCSSSFLPIATSIVQF